MISKLSYYSLNKINQNWMNKRKLQNKIERTLNKRKLINYNTLMIFNNKNKNLIKMILLDKK